MTHEEINSLKTRGYTFGNNKGVQVQYDAETDAVVMPETIFRYILKQIPSDKPLVVMDID